MAIPDNLAGWRYETVIEIVESYDFEPARFDFKVALNSTGEKKEDRDEHLASIRRTACAMANAGGGYILFGVRDRRQNVAKPIDRIVGVPRRGDHRSEFGNKMKAIQPEIHFEATPGLLSVKPDSESGVFVVFIPESNLRPHMVIPPNVFYRRGDGGTAVEMDFYGVRDQMLFTAERLRQVARLRLEVQQIRNNAQSMHDSVIRRIRPLAGHGRFDASGIRPVLANVCGAFRSDDLLKKLLTIPDLASFINNNLDAAHNIGMTLAQAAGTEKFPIELESVMNNITHNLLVLRDVCDDCELLLSESFGSLTGRPASTETSRSHV